jgi:hypothetical protein
VCAQYGETQHEKLQQLYRECVQFLKRRSLPGFFAVNITYLLALLAYQRGDVKSAKKLLYQLVYGNPKDVNVRSVFVSSYFLYLVLLWEEEDFSSLQSQLRRCSREIKGTMDLSASEKLFFELITSTSFLKKDSKILQRKIKETHQKMDTLLRDGKDHVNPTFFSFPDWLLAVLEKKNYFQVLRHKVLKKTN